MFEPGFLPLINDHSFRYTPPPPPPPITIGYAMPAFPQEKISHYTTADQLFVCKCYPRYDGILCIICYKIEYITAYDEVQFTSNNLSQMSISARYKKN